VDRRQGIRKLAVLVFALFASAGCGAKYGVNGTGSSVSTPGRGQEIYGVWGIGSFQCTGGPSCPSGIALLELKPDAAGKVGGRVQLFVWNEGSVDKEFRPVENLTGSQTEVEFSFNPNDGLHTQVTFCRANLRNEFTLGMKCRPEINSPHRRAEDGAALLTR
jgi:hypothetical protein